MAFKTRDIRYKKSFNMAVQNCISNSTVSDEIELNEFSPKSVRKILFLMILAKTKQNEGKTNLNGAKDRLSR